MKKSTIAIATLALLVVALGIYLIFTQPGAPPPKPQEPVVTKPVAPEPPKPEPPPPPKPEEKPPVAVATHKPVDEVVFIQEPDYAKIIDMLEAGQVHLHADGTEDAETARKIRASQALQSTVSYGSSNEITFNPVGPTFPKTGKLNPFSIPAIREALNWLINRDYVAQEIYGGLAVPRFFPLTGVFPDYARLADVARVLEIYYAHNPERAKAVIAEEMQKLGAELKDNRWHYQGESVRLIFIIRVEDKRREIGDYIAALLEDVGFEVDRQYKTSAEASPIWIAGDPADGKWHLYTAGWVSTVVSRDQAANFNFYYTARGRSDPLWQTYKPEPEFDEISDRLGRRDYKTPEERRELMSQALKLSMKDAVRVWLVDTISLWPRRTEVELASDLAGGFSGSWLWPLTIRSKEGGRVTYGSPQLLIEPWNPLAGSNWIFDTMIQRATGELSLLPDPFTGLYWPQRVKSAEVYVQEGLPVTKTHDWLKLNFLPTIEVPSDAWVDWDPVKQQFITVGEKHPEGLTTRTKTVIHYSDNLFKMKWHDGSQMSLADMVIGFIITFERSKKESAIFDEATVPAYETFMRHFRGLKIVQKDPLVVEVYSDLFYPDAEWIASARDYLYPYYTYGPAPWHKLAVGVLSEQNKELAFSSAKAKKLGVEWMSYIAGPSLVVLEKYRKQALEQRFIPYANTLGQYVTPEEAERRYQLWGDWYQQRKHFWVGQGPFYLDSVHTVEKNVVLKRFAGFPDSPDKWLRFSEPRIAEVEVTGPAQLQVGSAAEFEIKATFRGEPYPTEDIDFVKFLIFDARGELAFSGEAEAAQAGLWKVKLDAEQTARLAAGSNRLEVIVVSKAVSIPVFEEYVFVTVGS